jgi:hypothetical protein
MTDDERIIVAVPVAASSTDCVVTGSAKATCSGCGAEVWIAPSGQIMMRRMPDGTCKVLCLGCAREAIAADPEPEFSTTVEEAFKLLMDGD